MSGYLLEKATQKANDLSKWAIRQFDAHPGMERIVAGAILWKALMVCFAAKLSPEEICQAVHEAKQEVLGWKDPPQA